MRIGIIVDGQAEYRSLPILLRRVNLSHSIVTTLYADIQPFAPFQKIAATVKKQLPILAAKQIDYVVVLIDRESRDECPPLFASSIKNSLVPHCNSCGITSVEVVVKVNCYENWLIGDIGVLIGMNKRFSISKTVIRSIVPDKADNRDGQKILKTAAKGSSYSKVTDAIKIMNVASEIEIAANSRSFRRLLRVLDHNSYSDQSKIPI